MYTHTHKTAASRRARTKTRNAKAQGKRRRGAIVKRSGARMNPFNKGVAYGLSLRGASYADIAKKVRTVVSNGEDVFLFWSRCMSVL